MAGRVDLPLRRQLKRTLERSPGHVTVYTVNPSGRITGNGHGGLAAGDTTNGISEVDQQVASRLVGVGGFTSLFCGFRLFLLGISETLHRRLPAGPADRLQS